MVECGKCGRMVESYANKRNCRECYNSYMRAYVLNRYHTIRRASIESLGGVCVRCGSTDNLEFDHINPEDKGFTIGSLWSLSKTKLDAELMKCQLLCVPCHKDKTSQDWNTGKITRV